MRLLVACEYSARVRDAFRARGWDAWSCDFEPCEGDPQWHYQGDLFDIIDDGWDMMIAHPPCTYLTTSAEWAYGDGPYHQQVKPETLVGAARRQARDEAVEFFRCLLDAPIKHKAIENPRGVIGTRIRKADQTVQPYEYGEDASKATCLWLENLPPLVPTLRVPGRMVEWPRGSGRMVERWANQTDSGQNNLPATEDRWKVRSRTYLGIAEAMAEQWTSFVQQQQ